ncbi:MAG: replication-associated recombination protein A [Peptococcaceae bacterium]|nr:replication-associated recombination protein A [Peptococcaceae bacterium]
MDLFDVARENILQRESPLATRMRPQTLAEFVGQTDCVGPGKLLRRAIEADQLSSVIFYGPPGTGKTTLAQVIANTTKAYFVQLNAVSTGVGELKQIAAQAKDRLGQYAQRTILFVDEIHRFNKSQQDVLLPAVEDGTLILVGATTENPFFEVNSALLSRSRLFELRPLSEADIIELLRRALQDRDRGLGQYRVEIEPAALVHLANTAGGDARVALNALELAVKTTSPGPEGRRSITLQIAEDSIQNKAVLYDRQGDKHYDVISAFIKSLRGSDPDAALFWLAYMLKAGEDPKFIARRMIIHASEDIGLADPRALEQAVAAFRALEVVGLPEARLALAQAAIYIALAPKSNAVVRAIDLAMADAATVDVPKHLQDSHYPGAKQTGRGQGYLYPHDFPGNYVDQQYLPDKFKLKKYYDPRE